jgi:hypothetical protein
MSKTLLISAVVAVSSASYVYPQVVVAAPGVEARQDHKNIFDAVKYVWEQAQWADKLATLHSTLTTVREQLETANLVKQAIGDPVAAIALIENRLFSDYPARLRNGGHADRSRRHRGGGSGTIRHDSRTLRTNRNFGVD